jgi:hypothetical protein
LLKGVIDIEKIVLYKPVLLKDLKNKINSLLSAKQDGKQLTRVILH